jgi:hypothetical protein
VAVAVILAIITIPKIIPIIEKIIYKGCPKKNAQCLILSLTHAIIQYLNFGLRSVVGEACSNRNGPKQALSVAIVLMLRCENM